MPLRLGGLVSNLDTDSIIKELMSAQSLKKVKIENKITTHEWKQQKWKDLNTKIYSFYTSTLSKMRLQSSYQTKKAASSNESAVTSTATTAAPSGAHKIEISKLASAKYITGKELADTVTNTSQLSELGVTGTGTIEIKVGSGTPVTFEYDGTKTVGDFVTTLKNAGLNANFDEAQGRFFISSKESGLSNSFTITSSDADATITKLGLTGTGSQVVDAQDAEFTLNGAALTSASNEVTVNGLQLSLKQVTTGPVTLTVSDDTDATYDMVKDFVSKYNELLGELNDDYYAGSARGYSPLTDEQKESMSDDEIEKWESKIKGSLLRRDDILGGLLNSMKNNMSRKDQEYSLSQFGISTALYTEKGKLHIDGNSEDSLVADKPDKLRKALEENPEEVMKVLTKVCGDLYGDVQKRMKTTNLSSAMTVYNDKDMSKTLTNYKKDLSDMERKLKTIEDRYYKQFTAMEKAMSMLDSQSNSLASMLS